LAAGIEGCIGADPGYNDPDSKVDKTPWKGTVMKAKFHHFGVPTTVKAGKETYLDGAGVYITDPQSHPYSVEFLRFDANSPMPDAIKKTPHAAFVVESLDQAIKGKQVILPPTEVTPTLRVAFIKDGDALVEVMEMKE
jgi:hypothetical protein